MANPDSDIAALKLYIENVEKELIEKGVDVKERLSLLAPDKSLLLQYMKQKAAAEGAAAGPGPGSAAAAGAAAGPGPESTGAATGPPPPQPAADGSGAGDQTSCFLRSLALPRTAPSAAELPHLFTGLLMRNEGQPLKLPVHPWVYQTLCCTDGSMAELLELEARSKAWALSVLVSSALHPTSQLHDDLGDELSVAGRVDELFGRVLSLMARCIGAEPLKRKRNCTEQSLTTSCCRPDFMVLLRDALLLKGEDKPEGGSLSAAKEDLLRKVQGWSSVYHGQIEYLLCYACAGSKFELLYLLRGDGTNLYNLVNTETHTPRGKIAVIKAAILAYGIISQQQHQLPTDAQLMNSLPRGGYGSVLLGDHDIVKTVQWGRHISQGGPDLTQLQHLYNAVRGCNYVIHASEGPSIRRGQYKVTLAPRGQSLEDSWLPDSSEQLAAAIRCVLFGVRAIHAAGFGHADLRWPNIIKVTRLTFCVIDLELAVPLGSPQQHHQQDSDMPAVWEGGAALVNGHFTAASDLYMVGRMLQRTLAAMQPEGASLEGAWQLAAALASKATSVDQALQDAWLQPL